MAKSCLVLVWIINGLLKGECLEVVSLALPFDRKITLTDHNWLAWCTVNPCSQVSIGPHFDHFLLKETLPVDFPFASLEDVAFQNKVYILRNEFAFRGANSFLYNLTPIIGKKDMGRVTFLEYTYLSERFCPCPFK